MSIVTRQMDFRTFYAPKRNMDSFAPTLMRIAYEDHKTSKKKAGIQCMRDCSPKLAAFTDQELAAIYDCAVSSFQSKVGSFLEDYVESGLRSMNVPFQAQLHIDANGTIVSSGGVTIIDIVFGRPEVGTHISNYMVLSLKTTSRERAKLDGWARTYPPKIFYYGTMESDYPQPSTFVENESRKLVCVGTKVKDLRQFKFNFQDMVNEVRSCLPS